MRHIGLLKWPFYDGAKMLMLSLSLIDMRNSHVYLAISVTLSGEVPVALSTSHFTSSDALFLGTLCSDIEALVQPPPRTSYKLYTTPHLLVRRSEKIMEKGNKENNENNEKTRKLWAAHIMWGTNALCQYLRKEISMFWLFLAFWTGSQTRERRTYLIFFT